MTTDVSETVVLLRRWHAGDEAALGEILRRDLDWIRERVHRRLGDELRQKAETDDLVQEAMIGILRYGPRFTISDRDAFRALLARIVENAIRDRHDWFKARRRDMDREQPLPSGSVIDLDLGLVTMTTPSEEAERHEAQAWVRLALDLLRDEDRQALLLRQYDDLPFEEVASRLGLTSDAARMRFHRALARLAKKVKELRSGILLDS